jgi:UPF0755 protein
MPNMSNPRRNRRSCLPILLLVVVLLAIGLGIALSDLPQMASRSFGPPSPGLNGFQKSNLAAQLLLKTGDLLTPQDPSGSPLAFSIEPGETAGSVSDRLQQGGLIPSAASFRTYLVWAGLDTTLLPGTYQLSPSLTPVEIGRTLGSAGANEVTFYVLPGWRMEEIAAALPTSGLGISREEFLAAVTRLASPPFYIPAGGTAEGFLFPDGYLLARDTTAVQLVTAMLDDFTKNLTPGLRNGFTNHGLTVDQAVILASIVQRETMVDAEMPTVASVFYNRLAAGMKLETDPTVQYALGYNASQDSWWTNPLSLDDLKVDSPYNTYLYPGLPPAPISNPGLAALEAVANPAGTNYLYFRARCDGSGTHNFSETFEQHLQNACP